MDKSTGQVCHEWGNAKDHLSQRENFQMNKPSNKCELKQDPFLPLEWWRLKLSLYALLMGWGYTGRDAAEHLSHQDFKHWHLCGSGTLGLAESCRETSICIQKQEKSISSPCDDLSRKYQTEIASMECLELFPSGYPTFTFSLNFSEELSRVRCLSHSLPCWCGLFTFFLDWSQPWPYFMERRALDSNPSHRPCWVLGTRVRG